MTEPTPINELPGPEPQIGRGQVRLAVAVVAAVMLLTLFWPRANTAARTSPGGTLIDDAGRPRPLGPEMAPVTLVHFWATWCPPCLGEIPALHRLGTDLAGEMDFKIALIAVENDRDQVRGYLGEGAGEVLYDPDWDVAHRFGTEKLPETYLVVRGEVQEKYVGATNWDDPEIRARLSLALAEVSG